MYVNIHISRYVHTYIELTDLQLSKYLLRYVLVFENLMPKSKVSCLGFQLYFIANFAGVV